ncbi:type IV pilus assembly protein PilQ [Ferrimonas sediminum]|uniref:Type IV pilus assembly protein PilQ n=1 Tax=Ferrimonas sediminum TaxID=718193 RepID=A0A1G8V626_9GAMM|nr:type IV pilus secretin PilQ family protein [Ferrimonas sediminum]SDJ61501.1 type IV pilus assembly protein PilQ [Ferrimonas sediminum]
MRGRAFWATVLMMVATSVQSASLLRVTVVDEPGSQLQLALEFDRPTQSPRIQYQDRTRQLLLDFDGADSALSAAAIDVDAQGVAQLQASNQPQGLRVAIQLTAIRPYQGRWQGDRYLLTFADATAAVAALRQGSDSAVALTQVRGIEFQSPQPGVGLLSLHLSQVLAGVQVIEQGREVRLLLPDSELASDQLLVMDVSDLKTPVHSYETFSEPGLTSVVLRVSGAVSVSQSRQGQTLQIRVAGQRPETAAESAVYQGKRLSMNFQDVPVRTVLQIIAEHQGLNLVTSDSVAGNVTLRLNDVPWDQALALVLKVRGLASRLDGKVLLVAPREELAAQRQGELQLLQEARQLGPLVARHYKINYAKADDIAALLKGDSGSNRLLSNRGSATVDERTNILLLQDTRARLEEVEALIEVLDVPVKQVVIESRMVNVRDNIDSELGIRWGLSSGQGDGSFSGSIEGNDSIRQGVVPAIGDRLNVNLPAVANNASTFAFQVANLGDEFILDLELSALEAEDRGEIIASPRLTTSNQYTAFIEQGEEIPYEESTSSGATSVAFKKAVLSLTVTPRITSDNKVVLDLLVTQDTRGRESSSGEVGINTQRISTQVLAKNGETVVLGGIFQKQELKTVTKVPLLGDIPYAGWLFRNTRNTAIKSELLIFVTPKIIIEQF